MILPPKIYYYEPKIEGFKIVGKRGSKFYNPTLGNIKFNEDTMTGIDREKQVDKIKAQNTRANRFAEGGAANSEVQSLTQKILN